MTAAARRPVLLAWLLLTALVHVPYARAILAPPAERVFAGFLLFVDDQYNYLSFTRQAEDGAFLFRNKLVLAPHRGVLVNLEWWLMGRITALVGHHPAVAYRLFGAAAAALLVAALDRWLRGAGLPAAHRLPALLLVLLGGGLGGVARWTGALGGPRGVDLWTGAFPFMGLLANAHFTIGTALLLLTLGALIEGRRGRAIALGSALGLVRPYDLVLAVGVHAAVQATSGPLRDWPRRVLPLLGFAPVAAYNYWLFYRSPAFASYAASRYPFPATLELAIGLLPACVAALPAAAGMRSSDPWRRHLLAWAAIVVAMLVLRPVPFALQFLVGLGVPLLALAALALARRPPVVTLAATAVFGLSSVALLTGPPGRRAFLPVVARDALDDLAQRCRAGDLALLPAESAVYAPGLTACRAYSAHAFEPDHETRAADVRWFYGTATAEERALFLDRHCVRFVVEPGRGTAEERPLAAACVAWTE